MIRDLPGRTTGVDEVGVGALAGPVVAAAVVLGPKFDPERIKGRHGRLQDSKRMSKKRIPGAAAHIRKTCWVGIGCVSAKVIDRIGIRAATLKAMKSAIRHLAKTHHVDDIIVDGPRAIPGLVNQIPTVKADVLYPCVTAASLVAKAYRDAMMRRKAKTYPQFGFETNVGYCTAAHRSALNCQGPCVLHRRSFIKMAETCIKSPEKPPQET